MRIAILTLPLHTNYGGILQAYALQTILQRMGHEVQVIDKRWRLYPWRWYNRVLFYAKQFAKIILRKKFLVDWRHPSCYPKISSQVQPFVDTYIHIRKIQSWTDIHEGDYDAIVVGSDQIWRPMYVKYSMASSIEDVFLKFTQNWQVRRIAYAASFGVDRWEYTEEETANCRHLLQAFYFVSCRELSGVELCGQYLDKKSELVLDPTILLSVADYNCLCNNIPKQEGVLFAYIIDANAQTDEFVRAISKRLGKKIRRANARVEDASAPIVERIQPPIENWISGIRDASVVITDSYHACVFAMLYNKPFLVLKNVNRGVGRVYSVLELFGQANRYVNDYDVSKKMQFCYEQPNVDFTEWRLNSMCFIKQALQ